MIQCRLCGKQGHEAGLLQRVNPVGEDGIWECRPSCSQSLPLDKALIAAIEGTFDCQHPQVILGPPRRCANCGTSMPMPYDKAKTIEVAVSYTPTQLREELLYEYLGQAPEPGLFEFLDWLRRRERKGKAE